MRFAGIDIASEKHVVAVVDDDGAVVVQAHSRSPRTPGLRRSCFALLGAARRRAGRDGGDRPLLEEPVRRAGRRRAMRVALLNPLRTHRFAGEDLERTKTDAIDALGIARFAAQKRPATTRLPDAATEELRELVRLRDRLVQDFGDRVRQLHRLVDLGFPEFTRYVRTPRQRAGQRHPARLPHRRGLSRRLGSSALADLALRRAPPRRTRARRRSSSRPPRRSVGPPPRRTPTACRSSYACEDLDILRRRLRELDRDIDSKLRRARGRQAADHHRRHRPPDRGPAHRRARRPRRTSAAPARSPPTSASFPR